jgi:hypothetical protein
MHKIREPVFDIFRGSPSSKDAVWVETVEGLAAARARMEQIAWEASGQYFLFSPRSHAILAKADNSRLLKIVPISSRSA